MGRYSCPWVLLKGLQDIGGKYRLWLLGLQTRGDVPALHDMGTLNRGSAEGSHIGNPGLNGQWKEGVHDVGPKSQGRIHVPASSDYRIAVSGLRTPIARDDGRIVVKTMLGFRD